MVICERHPTLRKRVEVRHHVLRDVIGPKAVEDEKQMLVRRVWLHADHDGKRQDEDKSQGNAANHLHTLRLRYTSDTYELR